MLTALFEVSGNDRLKPMEGLRGIAVILVFLVHYVTFGDAWFTTTGIALFLKRIGNTGVELFFVLSGYLIYGSAIRKPQAFTSFMKRRIQRLYPAFLTVLALYLALSLVIPSGKFPDGTLAKASYLAANVLLLPGIFDIDPVVSVAWSLSYELFFYLSIPPLILLLGLRDWTPYQRMALFIALSVAALIFGFPWPRMIMFACGMVLSEIMSVHRDQRGWLNPASLVAVAFFWWGMFQSTEIAIVGGFVAGLLLCLAAFTNNGFIRRFFCYRPLRWLGNMSYSYYLAHGLGLHAFFMALSWFLPPMGAPWMFPILIVPAFLASLSGSIALYLLIERPLSIVPVMPKPAATPAAG